MSNGERCVEADELNQSASKYYQVMADTQSLPMSYDAVSAQIHAHIRFFRDVPERGRNRQSWRMITAQSSTIVDDRNIKQDLRESERARERERESVTAGIAMAASSSGWHTHTHARLRSTHVHETHTQLTLSPT